MLNSFQHLVNVFSATGRHTFHPRPQDGVFRCDPNKCSRHEAIHLLLNIMVKFLFKTLKEKVDFPLDSYRKVLVEYKSRKPEKIIRLLEKD